MLDLRGMLGPERDAFVELLEGLDGAGWQAPTECPAWDVKGIASHILGDDLSLLARQRDAATPGTFLYAETHPGTDFRGLLDGFNEQWVAAAQFLSPALLVELLRLTGHWTAEFYDATDPDTPGEPVGLFGATGPSPYWQIVAREYLERWAHHHQVRRAIGEPDLGPDFLLPAADVVIAGLVAHLPDLGAEAGRRVAVEITGLRTWALRRDADRWSQDSDSNTEADATVEIDPAMATAVLSRALDPAGVEAQLGTRGDALLGENLRATIARLAGRPS